MWRMLEVSCFLTLIALIAVAVDFSGEFAINDDWGYSTPIRWWRLDRELMLTHWQSMPLITQLFIGAVWTELVGFSQESLRWLTIAFLAVFVVSLIRLCRQMGMEARVASLVALTVLASPILLGLSFTFMTDVPAAALNTLALVVLAESLKSEGVREGRLFLLGAGLVLASVLLRQNAIVICLGLVAADLHRAKWRPAAAFRGLFLFALCSLVLFVVPKVFAYTVGLPVGYSAKNDALKEMIGDLLALRVGALRQTLQALLHFWGYFGLLCLPMIPLFFRRFSGERWNLFLCLVACAFIGTAVSVLTGQMVMGGPVGDILTSDGLLPRLLDGAEPKTAWIAPVLTLCCFGSALVAFTTGVKGLSRSVERKELPTNSRRYESRPELSCRVNMSVTLLVAVTAIALYAPHGLAYAALFDRYTLLPASLLLAVLASLARLRSTFDDGGVDWLPSLASVSLSSTLITGSLISLNGDFDWHRNRMTLLNYAITSLGIPSIQIDAGFEPNNLAHVLAHLGTANTLTLIDGSERPFILTQNASSCGNILLQSNTIAHEITRENGMYLCTRASASE
jgi:hypothetical protein